MSGVSRLKWCAAAAVASFAGCTTLHSPSVGEDCGERRAGGPASVACWARPSDTGRYWGYRVGGSSPCTGAPPADDEGLWGWDYQGLLVPARNALLWSHAAPDGAGPSAYRTDGPRLLPVSHLGP